MSYLRNAAAAVAAVAATATFGTPNAEAQEKYMAEVFWTASNFCPRGSMAANGQLLSINSYQALFSLLGTMYGGDGRTTFALPDLIGRTMSGADNSSLRPGTKTGTAKPVRVPGNLRSADSSQNVELGSTAALSLTPCIVAQGYFPPRS